MKHSIVERKAFTVIGRATDILIADKYTMLPRFWQTCKTDGTIAMLHELSGGNLIIGAGENIVANGCFRYMIGIEFNETSCGDWQTMSVPESRWVVFESVLSEPEYVGPVWQYIFNDFLPNNQYSLANTPDLEVNRRIDFDTYTCEVWIPVVNKSEHPE